MPRLFPAIALVLAVVGPSAAADPSAVPRALHRVVIIDFDGPPKLAKQSQADIEVLLRDSDVVIVPERRWEAAVATTNCLGKRNWRAEARAAGVDTIIEAGSIPSWARSRSRSATRPAGSRSTR